MRDNLKNAAGALRTKALFPGAELYFPILNADAMLRRRDRTCTTNMSSRSGASRLAFETY